MYANRRDHNQATVQRTLERLGVACYDASRFGGGFPDLVCSYRGRTRLLECKNPATGYGKSGLNKNQRNFQRRWSDTVWIARTEEEAELLVQQWAKEGE